MSIASELALYAADRENIRNAILAKGGTCPSGNGFDDFANDIASIPTEHWADASGVSPLTLANAVPSPLQNYRVYGDTNAVGNQTRNLFSGDSLGILYPIDIPANQTVTYTLKVTNSSTAFGATAAIYMYRANRSLIDWWSIDQSTGFDYRYRTSPTMVEDIKFVEFRLKSGVTADVSEFQAELGQTATEYIRYGFGIPMNMSGALPQNQLIYLNSPLGKTNNIADYIDYALQKVIRANGTEESIALPQFTTAMGNNVFTIGTTNPPSSVYAVYKKYA